MYNATSTEDENGDLETYENWLERQLISRIERLEQLRQPHVMCSVCEGTGILTEPDCCWDVDYIQKHGCCCGVPNPVQVQCKYCHG